MLMGFAVSALLHIGIATAIMLRDETGEIEIAAEHTVAVDLAMFAEPSNAHIQDADDNPDSGPVEESPPPAESEPAPEPALDANTESKPESAPEPEAAPKPKPKPKPKAKPKAKSTEPRPEPKREVRPPPRPTSNQSGDSSKSRTPNGSTHSSRGGGKQDAGRTKAAENAYLAGLRRAIAKKRRYPAGARRRGDTGVATVSFVLAKNGRISGTRVDKSSGSRALDEAAVETLRRLGRYKPIPEALGRTRWPLRVPIRFALE